MMRIAILGWGSLVWDQRNLPTKSEWSKGGPLLPLEFSRVSKDGRLTLVIDPINGTNVETWHAESSRSSIDDAIADLRDREGTVVKRIGYVIGKGQENSKQRYPDQIDVHQNIGNWAKESGYDAVVWTALSSQFKEETGKVYSVDSAIKYIESLPKSARKVAIEYIERAPCTVQTEFRLRAQNMKLVNA